MCLTSVLCMSCSVFCVCILLLSCVCVCVLLLSCVCVCALPSLHFVPFKKFVAMEHLHHFFPTGISGATSSPPLPTPMELTVGPHSRTPILMQRITHTQLHAETHGVRMEVQRSNREKNPLCPGQFWVVVTHSGHWWLHWAVLVMDTHSGHWWLHCGEGGGRKERGEDNTVDSSGYGNWLGSWWL